MSRPAVLACLFLAACEPVLLVADEGGGGVGSGQTPVTREGDAGANAPELDADAASDSMQATGSAPSAPASSDPATPEILLSVKAVDCGSCFDIVASGKGGVGPYEYAWEDGSRGQSHRVCAGTSQTEVWVIATDSAGTRSNARVTHLESDADATECPANTPSVKMCLGNLSFEGTAAINTGQNFDALPWTACTNPAEGDATNTPDIANDSLDPMTGTAPMPTEGLTYLTMSSGEQASQQLCEPLVAGTKTSLQFDAMRMNIGMADVFLQIWGGSSSDCSQRQVLWASPPLSTTWTTYCVQLHPSERMDLITLRAESRPDIVINYLAVDNLVAGDGCP